MNPVDVKVNGSKGKSESKENCFHCKENHNLDKCKEFTEKPSTEKSHSSLQIICVMEVVQFCTYKHCKYKNSTGFAYDTDN